MFVLNLFTPLVSNLISTSVPNFEFEDYMALTAPLELCVLSFAFFVFFLMFAWCGILAFVVLLFSPFWSFLGVMFSPLSSYLRVRFFAFGSYLSMMFSSLLSCAVFAFVVLSL